MTLEENKLKVKKLTTSVSCVMSAMLGIISCAPRIVVDKDFVIKTDGKIIKVGNKFFELPPNLQIYHFLHILLHVALRHHKRSIEIQHDFLARQVWEVATDCIVNYCLDNYINNTETLIDKKLDQANVMINFNDLSIMTFDKLPLEEVGFDKYNKEHLTAEVIFTFIYKAIKENKIDVIILPLEVDFNLSPTEFNESAEVLKNSGLDNYSDSDPKSKDTDLMWESILKDFIKSAGKGSKDHLFNDLLQAYKPKLNWGAYLRQYLIRRLSSIKQADYKRPSRRNLAGVINYFEPSRKREPSLKHLVTCFDVSGSCYDTEIMTKFVGHIDTVHEITNCDLTTIFFDDGITSIETVKIGEKLRDLINNNKIEVRGGGGTSFVEPIEEAVKFNPDVIVVFTDCWGNFPDEIKIPTIWASTEDEAPWGINLKIEE